MTTHQLITPDKEKYYEGSVILLQSSIPVHQNHDHQKLQPKLKKCFN